MQMKKLEKINSKHRQKPKKRRAKVIVVANRKGGVGKTFSSLQIAFNAALGGVDRNLPPLKVLLMDGDSQQHSSIACLGHLGIPIVHGKAILPANPKCPEKNVYSISDIFMGNYFHEYPTHVENLDVIPSDGNIDELKKEWESTPDDRFLDAVVNQLGATIDTMRDDYDLIVIDTPPSKTHICQAAMAVADDVIIMTGLDFYCAQSVKMMIGDIEHLNHTYRSEDNPVNILGVVPNNLSSSKLTNDEKAHFMSLQSEFRQYFHKGIYFVQRTKFKTTTSPVHPDKMAFRKDPICMQQARNFYNHIAINSLNGIYKSHGVNIKKELSKETA